MAYATTSLEWEVHMPWTFWDKFYLIGVTVAFLSLAASIAYASMRAGK